MLLLGGDAPSTPRSLATMRLRRRLRLSARAKDRSLDRKLLSLRCDPEQYSTLLWPLVTCNHSCIRQELACYSAEQRVKLDCFPRSSKETGMYRVGTTRYTVGRGNKTKGPSRAASCTPPTGSSRGPPGAPEEPATLICEAGSK